MNVTFSSGKLDQLETDPKFNAGFSQAIVTAFRKRMQTIRAAPAGKVVMVVAIEDYH